jgi:hypothetical protein
MKGTQAPNNFRAENGEIIVTKEDDMQIMDHMSSKEKDYLMFRSYMGQFCSISAHGLIREFNELDNNGEHNDPEEEAIGDENTLSVQDKNKLAKPFNQRPLNNFSPGKNFGGRGSIKIQEKRVGHI